MSNLRYTPEFKDEAARQIIEHGYSVTNVSSISWKIQTENHNLRTESTMIIFLDEFNRR